jgi:hypothetical protein
MDVFKLFDSYSLRARLFPAIIAAAPALAALALLISWKSFGLSNLVATLGLLVLLFAIADLSRTRGKAIEGKLYAEHGGMPSITMFRRNDATLNAGSKDRYREFFAEKLGIAIPTVHEENTDQDAADAFYGQCGNWLRQNTRDTKKFSILFSENVTYGFRRNLLGVKVLALCLNVIIVVLCAFILWRTSWDIDTPMGNRTTVVLTVAAAHAVFMLLAVNRSAAWDAAKGYGRELILSTEAFLTPEKPTRKTAARKKVSRATTSPPGP